MDLLLSIKPKYLHLIECGKKWVELRKTKPKVQPPFTVFLYESEERKKVVGKCTCTKISEYLYDVDPYDECKMMYYITSLDGEGTALEYTEIEAYGKGRTLYGWKIKDVAIFEQPFSVSSFKNRFGEFLRRPPQSWCYVQEVHKTSNEFLDEARYITEMLKKKPDPVETYEVDVDCLRNENVFILISLEDAKDTFESEDHLFFDIRTDSFSFATATVLLKDVSVDTVSRTLRLLYKEYSEQKRRLE